MTTVFVDTGYWIGLLHDGDAYHERVMRAPRPSRLVTTVPVLLEVMDAFSQPKHRTLALRLWNVIRDSQDVELVSLDESLLKAGVALFEGRSDKAWSLTDCISFVVMIDRRIADALTFDHHFEQAGFNVLLKDK